MNDYKYYLVGPMSGRPFFNIPAFETAARVLRAKGYDITTPVELDSEETYKEASQSLSGAHEDIKGGESWGTCLARDVKLLADELNAVIFLPEWEYSQGALLECYVAILCGHPLFEYQNDGSLKPLHSQRALSHISMNTETSDDITG